MNRWTPILVALAAALLAACLMPSAPLQRISFAQPLDMTYTPLAGLVDGPGWTGATSTPDPVGDEMAAGYGENSIAQFNCVPYQTVTTTLNVGVVAFHFEGINRVEFSVDQGVWVKVYAASLNPHSGTIEYWTPFIANRFTDGVHEIRAIVYPTSGVPRVLAGMYVVSNGSGTLSERYVYVSPSGNDATADGTIALPYQTLLKAAAFNTGGAGVPTACDRLTIYCAAGDYAWPSATFEFQPSNSNGWLTITAAPGVDPSDVRITSNPVESSSGFNTPLVKISRLTIDQEDNLFLLSSYDGGGGATRLFWWDEVEWIGRDNAGDHSLNGQMWTGFSGAYYTGCYFHHTTSQVRGGILVRDCLFETGSVAYSNPQMIINSEARDLQIYPIPDSDPVEFTHADAIQMFRPSGGVWGQCIMYGFEFTEGELDAQGIVLGPVGCRDVAIVNCIVAGNFTAFAAQQVSGTGIRHLLLKSCTFVGTASGWLKDDGQALVPPDTTDCTWTNVLIEDCTIPAGSNLLHPYTGVTIE